MIKRNDKITKVHSESFQEYAHNQQAIDAEYELTKLLNYYLDPKNILREDRKKKLEQLNQKSKL